MNFGRGSANYINATHESGYLIFQTSNGETALTLDASQNAQFNGSINSTANITMSAIGHNYIEFSSTATSTNDWRIYNGQTWNPDALLIYNHTGDSTVLTIEPGRLGINRGAANAAATLDVGGNIAIAGTEIIDSNKNMSSIGTINSGAITSTGNMTLAFDSNNSGNRLRIADTEGASAAVRTYSTSDGTGLILNHYYAASGSPYMRYSDFVSSMGDGAATTMRFLTKPHNGNPTVALTLNSSQNATFAGNINVTGTITGDDGLSIQGGTGNAYLQVGSDTGSWTWKNYRATHKLALEDSDGTGEVLSFDTSGTAKFSGGVSSDGQAKHYTWTPVGNTGGSGVRYVKICRVTAASQSCRFKIELTGRNNSYGDGSRSGMGSLVGQLNNDGNFDLSFYDFHPGSTNSGDSVVTEIAQVDIDTVSTDIYVKINSFSEVVATAVTSQGIIVPNSTSGSSIGSASAPTGYAAVQSQKVIMEDSASNVGIGTVAPTHKLTVNGAVRTNTGLSVERGDGEFLSVTHSGNESWGFAVESQTGASDNIKVGISGAHTSMVIGEGGTAIGTADFSTAKPLNNTSQCWSTADVQIAGRHYWKKITPTGAKVTTTAEGKLRLAFYRATNGSNYRSCYYNGVYVNINASGNVDWSSHGFVTHHSSTMINFSATTGGRVSHDVNRGRSYLQNGDNNLKISSVTFSYDSTYLYTTFNFTTDQSGDGWDPLWNVEVIDCTDSIADCVAI
jgi:hypothetical protein